MAKTKNKTKSIATGASLASKIQSATENLMSAKNDAEAAVTTLDKERKKLLTENKRLAKRKAVLGKKKKAAAKMLAKTPNAENRKNVSSINKELASVKKESDKSRAASSMNAEKLKTVKASLKQAFAYVSVIEKADKLLNKPRKKKRAKKRAIAA